MMQPRCAICDGDATLTVYCDTHYWQNVIRCAVLDGTVSDWEPLQTGKYPTPVPHARMMTSETVAYGRARQLETREERTGVGMAADIRRWVELAALLTPLGVEWAAPGSESPGDGLAVAQGVIAGWLTARLVYWLEQRKHGKAA